MIHRIYLHINTSGNCFDEDKIDSISAIELKEVIGSVNLLDVRKVGERNNGYLEQSFNYILFKFY